MPRPVPGRNASLRRTTVAFVLAAILLLAAAGFPIPGFAALDLGEAVVEHTTANGMKFLLLQRGDAPVFSAIIRYRVGGVDEPLGQTGIAHMYEHMAFKGTPVVGIRDYEAEKPLLREIETTADALTREVARREAAEASRVAELQSRLEALQEAHKELVVKDEFWDTYLRNGGTDLNASTSKDVTTYYVSLPSNRIELWALMEAQRMAAPVLREFYSERDVVAEERRMRTDTSPGGKLYEQFVAAAYTAHPYGTPTIGWMQDIQNLTAQQARDFFRTYYAPSNAVCAVVGQFDLEETIHVIDRYFGAIPAGDPAPDLLIEEPEQPGERRIVVEWSAQPELLIGYHKPTMPHADDYVFDVIDSLLSRGRSSRLYRALVRERKMAPYVGTYTGVPGSRYPNLFLVSTQPIAPHTTADLEAVIDAELERLKTEPVPEVELQKVRNNIIADSIRQLQSNMGLARQLTYFESVGGNWRYLLDYVERIEAVTAADIQRVAARYFTPSNRTVGVIQTKEKSS